MAVDKQSVSRVVSLGLAVSALIIASLALWRVTHPEEVEEAAPAPAPPPPSRLATPVVPSAELRSLRQRLDDLERKLTLLVAATEERKAPDDKARKAERDRVKREIDRLRAEVGSLAMAVSRPIAGADAAADEPDAGAEADNEADADAETDAEADAGATSDAGAADAGPAEPALVQRDQLVQTLRDQAMAAVVSRFAVMAQLDDAQRADIEDVVRTRSDAHRQVMDDVAAHRLSVRDGVTRIGEINERARKDLGKTLTQDQIFAFQRSLSRLDALWWHF